MYVVALLTADRCFFSRGCRDARGRVVAKPQPFLQQ